MSRVKKVPSLSVFFPCFNEEGNVVQLIEQFAAVLPQVAQKYEVIVIDDGSTDGTLKRVKEQKIKAMEHHCDQALQQRSMTGLFLQMVTCSLMSSN